ncbi:hypothetical protein ACWEWI_12255 [Streptomyces sp. NPDC003753]|uniref:hypothetical protein n=1 Tax=unclassified Streptomyces TaxID=2593676 RepID=UPI0019036BF7|nr:hypothetical protein [Streptomyces sp. Y2F8-2]GHK00487.1 hypothetical protein SY2F82_22840 [Streptomyces sp. Y2F8-2]
MPASERDEAQPRVVPGPGDVSMKDLLASCAAAKAVSTPPRDPAPDKPQPAPVTEDRRKAA